MSPRYAHSACGPRHTASAAQDEVRTGPTQTEAKVRLAGRRHEAFCIGEGIFFFHFSQRRACSQMTACAVEADPDPSTQTTPCGRRPSIRVQRRSRRLLEGFGTFCIISMFLRGKPTTHNDLKRSPSPSARGQLDVQQRRARYRSYGPLLSL